MRAFVLAAEGVKMGSLIALLLAGSVALAQSQKAAPAPHGASPKPPRVQTPLEFKGVPFGASYEAFVEKNPGWVCQKQAAARCEELGLSELANGVDPNLTYATERVLSTTITFIDGSLEQVVMQTNPESFAVIVEAVSSKYGKPSLLKQQVQNRMGAQFTQVHAIWMARGGSISALKYGPSLDWGTVSLTSEKAGRLQRSAEEAKKSAASKDL